MTVKSPLILILLLLLPLIYFLRKRQKEPALIFPSISLITPIKKTWKIKALQILGYLRLAIIGLFIIGLAGPRSVLEETEYKTEGIDIILAIDASGTMAAEDFTINNKRYNRLEVVKDVVRDFISARQHDRIGLVAFSAMAYTASPLTTDYSWLKMNLDRIQLGLIEDGTAIGSAIASSLSRLKKSHAKSKVIILLTDGMNNAGKIDPLEAAQAARAFGVKIYTIGAGTKGYVPFPVIDMWGRKVYQKVQINIDEETLAKIAELTRGKYFRATDTNSLKNIYKEIDALEKVQIEQLEFKQYKELFFYFVLAGLFLLILELIVSHTLILKIP